MSTAAATPTAEAEIETLIDRWRRDVQSLDVDRIMSHYAPGIRAFDAASTLQFNGAAAYREHWRECPAHCPGPMIFEIQELQITTDENIAFAHFLNRCGVVDSTTGEERASWMRSTSCFRRIEGQWRIVHEHFSAPFDIETHAALLDLEP